MGGDQNSPSASSSLAGAAKSSSRIVMRATIANRRRRYQSLVEGVENDVSPLHHRVTERFLSEGMSEKAFGHAVMEGTMTLSEGGHGPAEHGFAIDFLIVVTL